MRLFSIDFFKFYNMDNVIDKLEELSKNTHDYVNIRIEEVKFELAEKSSGLVANLVAGLTVAVMLLFFVLFASIALALSISNWLHTTWAGFLIVAFLYLFIGLLIWLSRRTLIQLPVMNSIIKQLFKQDEED